VRHFTLQVIVLSLAAVSLGQQSAAAPPIPAYPDSAAGLERMMGDMISLQTQGQEAALTPYLQSLVLPEAEAWFTSRFGNARCGEALLAANDCLGPRLALAYEAAAPTLPASIELTLKDLISEGLTSFEAVNHTEACAGPLRIIPSLELVGDLTTTPILSSMLSGLVQNHEPVYVLWIYSETKETTLAFLVYSEGAFRYIGMPRPISVEYYREMSKGVETRTELAPPAHYLTGEQLEMKPVLVDPAIVQRTIVLQVAIGKDGKVTDVSYLRGPVQYKDAAIKSARKRKFEPPGFSPKGFHPNNLCVNEAAPR
jgi:hypothetical protein